ncbi:MAG: YafY family protein [Jatrophihabitans sp.]
MRASRLLSILLTLNVRGQVSAAALAAELEVSRRTIYRDVDALSAAGVPVYATRGRNGGIRLLDGYRTRLTGMSADEADAMFLAAIPGAAADLGLGSVLAATQLKLLSALPPELRERAARIRETLHVDAPGWLRETTTPPFLAVVAEAAWSQHLLEVRYERANRTVADRVLAPLGLVLKAGIWYLVADVADPADDGRGPRTYRVSRVQAATPRDDMFERPTGFDLEDFWTEYQRGYADRVYRESAVVRVDEQARRWLFLLGSIPAERAHAAMSKPDVDGWARTVVPIESVRHARHSFMQLGEHLEVLEPLALRDAIAATADELVRRYASGGPAESTD